LTARSARAELRVALTSHLTLKQDKTAPISPDIAAAIDIIMARPNAAMLKNSIKIIAGVSLSLAAAVISKKLENAKMSGKYNKMLNMRKRIEKHQQDRCSFFSIRFPPVGDMIKFFSL
jgi:hypothetical protein